MKPYEFMRFLHPKLGRFVYKHKGSGIIVDNIFKPVRRVTSSLGKTVVKKAVSTAGEKLGKKAGEKRGDFIMIKLASKFNRPSTGTKPTPSIKPQQESTDMTINSFISGSGIKRMRHKIV